MKKFLIIMLSLMLVFSLSLTMGCKKAKETAEGMKGKAEETAEEVKEKAAETAGEGKEKAAGYK